MALSIGPRTIRIEFDRTPILYLHCSNIRFRGQTQPQSWCGVDIQFAASSESSGYTLSMSFSRGSLRAATSRAYMSPKRKLVELESGPTSPTAPTMPILPVMTRGCAGLFVCTVIWIEA